MTCEMARMSTPVTSQLSCAASELGVRSLLARVRRALHRAGLSDDLRGSVEIALAECLNNIVEHACVGLDGGQIRMDIHANAAHVFVQIQDSGRPFPDWRLPSGCPTDLGRARSDLPEGGFGWNLIHSLCDRVHYTRADRHNCLKLWFARKNRAI